MSPDVLKNWPPCTISGASRQVGNIGLSHTEQISHFALWCLITGPLLISTDLNSITNESLAILTSPELIAVNQDPGGVQGVRVSAADPDGAETWSKPLVSGKVAAVFLNRSPATRDITASFETLGLPTHATVSTRDLWLRKDLAMGVKGGFTAKAVPSHGMLAVMFSPVA